MYYEVQEEALSNGLPFHVGAILWRGKTPIRIGINRRKTHPDSIQIFDNGMSSFNRHAEFDALRACKPGDHLVVLRWNKNRELTMAKPCKRCQEEIKKNGVKKVTYSNWDGELVTVRVHNL